MRDLSIEEIETAADPVAACKEQIRRWKDFLFPLLRLPPRRSVL